MIAEPAVSHLYAERALQRLRLNERSLVVELGNYDEGSLEHFATRHVHVLRFDIEVFNSQTSRLLRQEHGRADLIVGRHRLSNAVDHEDFVGGLPLLLAWNGTMLLSIADVSSVHACQSLLERHALRLYDVDELATPGGPLETWGCHSADVRRTTARLRHLMQA
jgi:hypothetical protein